MRYAADPRVDARPRRFRRRGPCRILEPNPPEIGVIGLKNAFLRDHSLEGSPERASGEVASRFRSVEGTFAGVRPRGSRPDPGSYGATGTRAAPPRRGRIGTERRSQHRAGSGFLTTRNRNLSFGAGLRLPLHRELLSFF